MENKEDEGFYHSLSRKELQSLCKKYSLPANRSHSDMAKSLASFLESQRTGSMTVGERLYGIQEAGHLLSLNLQHHPGASLNSFRDAVKDRCNGGNYLQAVQCNALGSYTVDKFYHKDKSKINNWGESSECSQDDLFENCGGFDNVESNGLGKKRSYIGDQNDCSMLNTKILRSTKHLIKKVLPRRSMQLVPK